MNVTELHVKKLIAGSYEDFTVLYHRYASQLYAFVFHLTGSQFIAKDIVQDTFLKVWLNREQIDLKLSFRAYLFTIAKNQILNEFRRQMNNPIFSDYMHLNMEENFFENTTEQKIDFDEFNRLLCQSKKKLSPAQSRIFGLNKEQGISVKEIAQMLNITEQTVRNQLSAALHILRKEMGKYSFLLIIIF